MKKYTEGSASNKIIALMLIAALVLSFGVTALATGADNEPMTEDIVIVSDEQPVEDPAEDPVDGEPAEEPSEEPVDEEPAEEPAAEEPVDEEPAEEPVEEPVEEEPAEEPMEELESPQTYLFGPVNDEIIEAAATEIAAMPEELREQIVEIWNQNHLVYDDPEEMLAVYQLEGVSDQAAFVLILVNIDSHVAFINHGFSGADRSYLEQYDESYERICEALNELGVTDLADEGVRELLLVEISEAYAGMRWAEENEEAGTGFRTMFDVANTYWDEQSDLDIQAFFELCEGIVG